MEAGTTPSHSAGPQAIGYLHQARYALLRILESDEPEKTSVMIEGLDDVEVQGQNGVVELDQLKHHISEKASLTDKSPDLWKTIKVWSDYFTSNRNEADSLSLNLVTTAEAPDESAASVLREESSQDIEEVDQLLLDAAETSKNEALEDAFESYKDISKKDRKNILKSITVYDESYTIEEASERIKRILLYSVDKKYLDNAFSRLEGWWFDRVVRQIIGRKNTPIQGASVISKLHSIADQFRAENLPIDFSNTYLDPGDREEYESRMFVKQLEVVAANAARVKNAIIDFYRAFQQRSKWVSEDLVFDNELEKYERKLIEEWERRKAAYEDEVDKESSEKELKELGRKILRWVELEADIPIRPKVEEKYVVRGSYHMLADEKPPRVHWHPEFENRVEEILSDTAVEA